jgi:hypothetical protein
MGLFRKRPTERVIDLRTPVKPVFEFGHPLPCPSCGAGGYLDRINMRTQVMVQHCPSCFTRYETSNADLAVLNA